MSAGGFALALVAWLVVAVLAGLAVGRVIRRADLALQRHP